ncbi:MAG: VWA domain-containing protein [Pseudomonadota bacterium]|jgi:Ca-activated chloride channel family protein|nr:VWA domain-containing protein [Rubrivivax sp.]MCA3259058.1 VWA domain-containing protein [Rubrivivax sp.]MCE2912656.1 VWA domain-containing protein [Rubrivivax sp.]MCZ8032728.1 VWA domain-containing protein [Rubrivivax sp.]
MADLPSWTELAALLAQVEWALPAAALAWPLALAMLLLPPHRSRRTALRVPFFALAVQGSGEKPRPGAVVLRHGAPGWLLLGLAWTAAVAAAMQPQWVEPPVTRVQPTRDWLLAVDLSPSMRTADFRGADGRPLDRLGVVREVTEEFLERRSADRIGLLVFGQQPFVQVPFTLDHAAVRALLAESRIGMAGTRTMIGDAIGLALRVFEESEAPHRTLVLLTDGRDTGSRVPPAKAAEIAAQRGVRMHTVAIGTAAARPGEEADFAGLQAWAAATGGRAFRATDRAGLQAIYGELDAIEKRDHETQSARPRRPLFHWPLGVALGLLGLHVALALLASAVSSRRGEAGDD